MLEGIEIFGQSDRIEIAYGRDLLPPHALAGRGEGRVMPRLAAMPAPLLDEFVPQERHRQGAELLGALDDEFLLLQTVDELEMDGLRQVGRIEGRTHRPTDEDPSGAQDLRLVESDQRGKSLILISTRSSHEIGKPIIPLVHVVFG